MNARMTIVSTLEISAVIYMCLGIDIDNECTAHHAPWVTKPNKRIYVALVDFQSLI